MLTASNSNVDSLDSNVDSLDDDTDTTLGESIIVLKRSDF